MPKCTNLPKQINANRPQTTPREEADKHQDDYANRLSVNAISYSAITILSVLYVPPSHICHHTFWIASTPPFLMHSVLVSTDTKIPRQSHLAPYTNCISDFSGITLRLLFPTTQTKHQIPSTTTAFMKHASAGPYPTAHQKTPLRQQSPIHIIAKVYQPQHRTADCIN